MSEREREREREPTTAAADCEREGAGDALSTHVTLLFCALYALCSSNTLVLRASFVFLFFSVSKIIVDHWSWSKYAEEM